MVIEDLKERYPLLYKEAITVYEQQRGIGRYRSGYNIMDIGWGNTAHPTFWSYVYKLYQGDNLEKCKSIRPELFDKTPEKLLGAQVINNGLFG